MIDNTLNPVNIIFLGVLLAMVPFFLTLTTSYIKIIVVTYLVRNALGVQQVPPTMVLTGLAIILSIYVMAPVGLETYQLLDNAAAMTTDLGPVQLWQTAAGASEPLHRFLLVNTEPAVLKSLVTTASHIWPDEIYKSVDSESFVYVIPSFVISELTKAFQIGFLIYLPFIAIDLIISNILLAMGMMMVSPMTISLPFKLMLFVTLDGWLKLSEGMLYSYSYG